VKPRFLSRNRTILVGDLLLIIVCVLGSAILRVPLGARIYDFRVQILIMLIVALIMKPSVYYLFGLYRRLWEYASIRELKLIAVAVTTASIILSVIVSVTSLIMRSWEFSRGFLVIDWLLSLLAVGGIRFSYRIIMESRSTSQQSENRLRRVMVVGAGDAGALVVREMQRNPQANLKPVGFVDDDPAKQKQEIHGTPVIGKLSELARLIESKKADEVIIAIPSAPGQVVRKVAEVCRIKNIPSRTMPSLHELIGGKVSVNRLREVEITDLLRRAPAHIDSELVGLSLNGRRVLVTGAGGSIGRELCRQIARWEPKELFLLGHGENSIFETLVELEQSYPTLTIQPLIADIRDIKHINHLFSTHHPQVVFHTAAHKHVPLMQANIEEAISNNVLGTRVLVEAAINNNIERLVMISTDKAICPTSVYGATKRLGEMLVLDAAHRTGKSFSIVRFGNVLGSRGSVLLRFKRQIDYGGPVTVTHPDMERYFMTIPEAVHLVLQASAMGEGGEVFVLNMGEQIKILELAQDLIRLSGLEPGKDIQIVFTGIRPGEKLREALWDEGADYIATIHPDILRLNENEVLSSSDLQVAISSLIELGKNGDPEQIVNMLNAIVPGAAVSSTPIPDLTSVI
jgi:FlaA1/EpsC-like NDP-sugar epimerase